MFPDSYYEQQAVDAFNQGMEYISECEYGKAYYCFLEAIRIDGTKSKFYFFAGLASYYFQEEKATEYFGKAAMMDMHIGDYQMWYGISLYRDERYQEARKVLLYGYSIDNKNDKTIEYLIKTLNRLGEYQMAREIVENGIDEGMLSSEILYEVGFAYFKEFEYEKAEEVLLKSIECDATNASVYYFLSRLYCKLGDFENAIRVLELLREADESEGPLVESNINAIQLLQSF